MSGPKSGTRHQHTENDNETNDDGERTADTKEFITTNAHG